MTDPTEADLNALDVTDAEAAEINERAARTGRSMTGSL